MNSLETRKQLLIAESELNRALLFKEVGTLVKDASTFIARAHQIGTMVASTVALATGFTALLRGDRTDTDAKPTWTSVTVKSVGFLCDLWQAFQPKAKACK